MGYGSPYVGHCGHTGFCKVNAPQTNDSVRNSDNICKHPLLQFCETTVNCEESCYGKEIISWLLYNLCRANSAMHYVLNSRTDIGIHTH